MLDVSMQYPSLDDRAVATLVVWDFEVLATHGTLHFPDWRRLGGERLGGERGPIGWNYPPLAGIRAELAGKNLACWCPLNQPCHADVLLKIANAPPEPAPLPTYAAAQFRLLIHDLDNARADGTVLTYGYIQHRLRAIPEPPPIPNRKQHDDQAHCTQECSIAIASESRRERNPPCPPPQTLSKL